MELLRYQIFVAIGLSFLSIWLALIKTSDATLNPLVLYAPVWSIILLGLYAIGSVVLGLMSFKDTPEAAAEIERQIVEAKAEMKKRGIVKDR
jgi:dolichyl-phosphate mannosyltransferase polypeptide 3